MVMTPDGSAVGSSCAPSHEYLAGVSVAGTPYSLASAMVEASSVEVSRSLAVAMMSPCRFDSCRTGVSLLCWVAMSPPVMHVMLRM
jgi:hypothetical protein